MGPGGARRVVPARICLYELLLDGSKSYRVAEVDERELTAVPRALPGGRKDFPADS